MPDMTRLIEANRPIRKVFGKDHMKAMPKWESPCNYDLKQLAELVNASRAIASNIHAEDIQERITAFNTLNEQIREVEHPQKPVLLWPEGKIPTCSEYTDNAEYLFKQNPDYVPHMWEILLPDHIQPKGAILLCAGGDHGESDVNTYQVALDLNAMGYQCFLVNNRPNMQPWKSEDAGVDCARAVRYVRSHAKEYRIREDHIAFAGFSNGGLTGEALIQYYSRKQTVKDIYPDYEPDSLDDVSANLNAFICVYGPRFNGDAFDYTNVVYPPTFFAVGREDNAMNNLHWVYPDLVAHQIPVEVHTFAGTPHGKAGAKILDGEVQFANFELWLPLADAFLENIFQKIND